LRQKVFPFNAFDLRNIFNGVIRSAGDDGFSLYGANFREASQSLTDLPSVILILFPGASFAAAEDLDLAVFV